MTFSMSVKCSGFTMRRLIALCTCLLLLGTAPFVTAQESEEGIAAQAYQTTNLRSGPETRFDIVGQVAADEEVTIVGRDPLDRWLLIHTIDGINGWVPVYALVYEGDLNLVPVVDESNEANGDEVWITAYGRVNLRSAPDIAAEVVGQMDIGDTAPAIARCCPTSDWLYVVFEPELVSASESTPEAGHISLTDTVEGWVAYFTVNITGDLNSLPILTEGYAGGDLVEPSSLVSTRFNARIRTAPAIDSQIVTIVPFNATVQPLGRTSDNQWVYVAYDDTEGWGSTPLFDISGNQLNALPVLTTVEATQEAA